MNFNTLEEELYKKLTALAFERSNPFCYGCYKTCLKGRCPQCYSDDLMREVEGVGVEWGTDWVIKHILKTDLTEVDADESFEASLEGCYPETTQIGFLEVDTISAMKELDPVTFEMAKNEHMDFEHDDGRFVSFDNGSTFYLTEDVEHLVRYVDSYEVA